MDYDFGSFLLALKAVERTQKDLILANAAAIGVAFGGENAAKDLLSGYD